jgi:putative acetyltransferase
VNAVAPVPARLRARLLDLWVEAWTDAMPQIDFEARRAWFDARLDACLQQGTQILGSFDGERLDGFVTVDPASGEIDQLCVARPAQGRGLAAQLVEAARALSPGGLSLTVNLDNPRALRFYARSGFVRGEEGSNPLSGLRTVRMLWRPIPPP